MSSADNSAAVPERSELRPGYSISRVIKGGWQLAGGHGAFERAEAVSAMTDFVQAGITTFDCADIYTGVEAMIGDAIELLRKQKQAGTIQVHTKLVPDLNQLATLRHRDIEAIVERSLQRLKIDQLHLLQFYWWDLSIGDPVGSFEVLKRLRDQGRIKHLGCTNLDQFAMQAYVQNGFDLVSAQVQYSLLDSRPAGDFSHWCQAHDIKLLCYGVLAGGFLTDYWLGKPDPGFQFENRSLIKYRLIIEDFGGWDLFQQLLSVLAGIAAAHAVPLASVAARYMLDQPQVAAIIIGAKTARYLQQTLSIFSVTLSADERQQIQAVLNQATELPGTVYALERDRKGAHGRIMKYNLNSV